jgi:hypothetical protein
MTMDIFLNTTNLDNLFNWLPMLPNNGPPLPIKLEVYWPWVNTEIIIGKTYLIDEWKVTVTGYTGDNKYSVTEVDTETGITYYVILSKHQLLNIIK